MNCSKVKLESTQNSRRLAVVAFTSNRKIFGGRSTDRVASVTPLYLQGSYLPMEFHPVSKVNFSRKQEPRQLHPSPPPSRKMTDDLYMGFDLSTQQLKGNKKLTCITHSKLDVST